MEQTETTEGLTVTTTITPELLDQVNFELEIRADYPDAGGEAIIPISLLRRLGEALTWAGDEITQLREDLAGSTGAVVGLTIEAEAWRADLDVLTALIAKSQVPA